MTFLCGVVVGFWVGMALMYWMQSGEFEELLESRDDWAFKCIERNVQLREAKLREEFKDGA